MICTFPPSPFPRKGAITVQPLARLPGPASQLPWGGPAGAAGTFPPTPFPRKGAISVQPLARLPGDGVAPTSGGRAVAP
jgi:hypothetical protein